MSFFQETVELFTSLGKTQTSKHNSVPVKCMSFPTNEYNSFVVGAEDGYIYGAVRHGSKPGSLNSHQSPQKRFNAYGPYK